MPTGVLWAATARAGARGDFLGVFSVTGQESMPTMSCTLLQWGAVRTMPGHASRKVSMADASGQRCDVPSSSAGTAGACPLSVCGGEAGCQ